MVQPENVNVKQHEMPVVLQNLPPAETLNQMIDNLNFLSLVMDEAFSAIQSQIVSERTKIDSITQRVSKASNRIDLIAKYPNKATTVYSSSIFPSSVNEENQQIDETLVNVIDETDEIKRPKFKLSIEQRLERAPITDTLQLYGRLSERIKYRPNNIIRGLGNLPSKITSVSDCLLFNTDENPYMKYESSDNLQSRYKTNENANNNNGNANNDEFQLFDAPKTIKEKNRLMDGDTYDIAYHPEMGDVPRFSVTTTLSGLGNLALDIGWQGTKSSNQKIAPSSVAFQDLPELHVQPDMLPGFDEVDDTAFGDFADVPPPAPPQPPPSNPAPPPSALINNNNNNAPVAPEIHVQPNDVGAEYRNNNGTNNNNTSTAPSNNNVNNSNQAAAAPIAPPRPPKAPSPAPSSDDGGGGRGGLLAAIRAGKKLKNSKERKTAKKAPAKPKTLSLMDHLKMKLQARNKVMRGDTDATGIKSGGGGSGDAPGLSLAKDTEVNERDDLGIAQVPDTMRQAMHWSNDEMSSGPDEEWDD